MNQFWMLMLASIASVVTAADFAVADYGARADGMKCTAAFAKAMGEAAKAGGRACGRAEGTLVYGSDPAAGRPFERVVQEHDFDQDRQVKQGGK